MSYEYRLVFDEPLGARQVMDKLRASADCVRAADQVVEFKDPGLGSRADHDLRLTLESDQALWMELLFRTAALHDCLEPALRGRRFRCLEDGDSDDEVALEQVFALGRTLPIFP
ncbi:MAG: hypothetical protein ACN6QY_09630 [Pseudomonas sp.]|uniref:hypothetical protein n=1 Tax=unclassified Pseudomonas TaxID=196821 RepID=UPI0007307296|nr:hypothetical protein [Pseudomonas sp. L5B5]KTC35147.1 hypothetical protein AO265_35645 [Pseudomonas sp. ABAC61]UCZ82473.1 hypothetical protein LGQ10_19100 [Pseudomonas sp. L5B5]